MAKKITLTKGQKEIFNLIKEFSSDWRQKVFILKGYAGTGKTTLVKYIIDYFSEKNINFRLVATTGRAAAILSDVTQQDAKTIHSMIYTYQDFNQDVGAVLDNIQKYGVDSSGQLFLNFGLDTLSDEDRPQTVYIVDESSMLSDVESKDVSQAKFGSGRLLSDLLAYDDKGKFIFVGDNCQLPPIEQTFSPALSPSYFSQHFNIIANSRELTEIVRQDDANDIIKASIKIREQYALAPEVREPSPRTIWGKLPLRNYQHIDIYPDQSSFLNDYISLVKQGGYGKATLICDSNKQAMQLSLFVRSRLGFSGNLQVNDLLLVTQNNSISGLINGDFVVVKKISPNVVEKANLRFRQVEVEDVSNGKVFSQLIIEDILNGGKPNLDKEQQKRLAIDFAQRMKAIGLKQKDEAFKKRMFDDPYYNALRCVYGYAITCHKSQGGEWPHVFVDLGKGRIMANPTKSSYQWIYTAMTRAKEKLHLIDGFYIEGFINRNRRW